LEEETRIQESGVGIQNKNLLSPPYSHHQLLYAGTMIPVICLNLLSSEF